MVKKLFKAWLFDIRKRRAIRKARQIAKERKLKVLVLVFNGKPAVVTVQGIRKLIRQHRFKKGFTAEQAVKLAIYIAYPNQKA